MPVLYVCIVTGLVSGKLLQRNKCFSHSSRQYDTSIGFGQLYPSNLSKIMFFDLLPANVLLVSVVVFIPSSNLPLSPINLTAVTYTLYIVYGVKLSSVYVPVKLVTSTTCSDWS